VTSLQTLASGDKIKFSFLIGPISIVLTPPNSPTDSGEQSEKPTGVMAALSDGNFEDISEHNVEAHGLLPQGSEFTEDDYVRKKNWPVCKPIVYHNIIRDIDDAKLRHAIYVYYFLWYVLCGAFTLNVLAVAAAFWSLSGDHWSNWVGLILSLFYFGLCWPLAFVLYYYLAYEGARLRSGVKMGTFFCVFPLQILLCAWLALGIPKSGGGGLVLLVHASEGGAMGTSVLNAMSLLVWICSTAASGYVLFMLWRAFRNAPAAMSLSFEHGTTETVIDADEEAAKTKEYESAEEGQSSSSSFSSWGMPAKLDIALPTSISKENPAEPPKTSQTNTPPPASPTVGASNYSLPVNFLE